MKRTKTKLVSSIVTLLICFAMLIGSTFAWFTDSASTGVNTIQAGNLDIQLLNEAGTESIEGGTLNWVKATGSSENEPVLWEPGVTYYTQGFQIKNAGNLALKFKITINGVNGDADLLDAIDFYLVSDKSKNFEATNAVSAFNSEYYLAAEESWTVNSGATSSVIYLAGHMREDAGNEYQGLSLDNIGITLAATQDTVESDSFDSNYDERSIYPVIPVLNNTTLTGKITQNEDVTLGNLDDPNSPTAAQIIVPSGAVNEDTNVVFSIQLTDSTPDSTTYEISLKNEETGDSVTLSNPAVITANIGTDLTNVKVKHNDRDMTENATGEDGTYQYNRSTGILTIYTQTFSPFQITYKFHGVASLNGVAYSSINAAIDAAKDDETIVLLDNISVLNTSIEVQEGAEKGKTCISIQDKGITIDGNGKVITLIADDPASKTYGIYITGSDNSKTVTIKNATIKTKNLERAIRTYDKIGFKIENSTITTNGVGIHVKGANTVDICNTQITVNAIDAYSAHKRTGVMVGGPNANVKVDGCTINAINNDKNPEDTKTWCKGLYVGNSALDGNLTVNNTKVEADWSICIDGTENVDRLSHMTINGGEYSGIIGSPSGNDYKSLIITGGTFTGNIVTNSFNGNGSKLVISGGTFNFDPSSYVADGHGAAKDESKGTWTVSENN